MAPPPLLEAEIVPADVLNVVELAQAQVNSVRRELGLASLAEAPPSNRAANRETCCGRSSRPAGS